MKNEKQIAEFWQDYLDSLPAERSGSPASYETWFFCDNEESANELGGLVLEGIKTATCSLAWAYEAEGERIPEAGDLSVITNWDGDPLCVIETTEVEIKPFNQVDEQFAYDEGEGDRSLAFWRNAHLSFFSRECDTIGREVDETMPVVCERFRVVFPVDTPQ